MELCNLKSAIKSKTICQPIIFRNFSPVHQWSFSAMTVEKMADILQDVKVKFRIGKQEIQPNVQWEGDCHYIHATFTEFCNWTKGLKNCAAFDLIDKESCWAYADYMYMQDLFQPIPDFHISEHIDWSKLGFGKDEGLDMAIWIGTKGAHTVCHYDTYGYNIVVQVSGRKRWTMFPPNNSPYLYPTRIPYEESTVFSKVNILKPDLLQHPRFSSTQPHVVVLEPGDVLYVPTHWWHFVENLELSISVNAWFPCDSDPQQRVSEAITRLLIGASVVCEDSSERRLQTDANAHWINPTESISTVEENIAFLRNALIDFHSKFEINKESEPSSETILKEDTQSCDCSLETKSCLQNIDGCFVNRYCFKHACGVIENWKGLCQTRSFVVHDKLSKRPRLSDSFPPEKSSDTTSTSSDNMLTVRNVFECLTRPTVVEVIRNELEKDKML